MLMHCCPRQIEGCSHSSRSGNTQETALSLPPAVSGRLAAGEDLLPLQLALPKGSVLVLSSIPHLPQHPPSHEAVIRAGITDSCLDHHGQGPIPRQAGESDCHDQAVYGRPVGREDVQVCMCVCTFMRECEVERTKRPWRDGSSVPGEHYLPSQLCLPAETARVYPE